jgi:hypothetical protein
MNFRKKVYFLFQVFSILISPCMIVFFTAYEMWIHLAKFSIYCATALCLFYFEVFEVLAWRWKKVFKYNDFD